MARMAPDALYGDGSGELRRARAAAMKGWAAVRGRDVTGRLHDQAAEAELARGVALHRAGRLGEAEAAYRAVLARNADHPYALNYLGVVLGATGRAEAALDALRRSVKHLNTVPEFHLNLADTLMQLGRLDGAEAALRKALHLKRSADALMKMGLLLYRQGKLRPAAHQFEQALQLDPAHLDARHNAAITAVQLGNVQYGERLTRGTLSLSPANTDALNGLAVLEQKRGAYASAICRLSRALAVSPAHSPSRANIAHALNALGRAAEAGRHARIALSLTPSDPRSFSNFGNGLLASGEILAAARMLRRALALDGRNPDILSNLGRALNPIGRTEEAIALYRRAIEIAPKHAAAHGNLLFAMTLSPATTNEALYAEHQRWAALEPAIGSPATGAPADFANPTRVLRIGFLSADLRDHPIGHLVSGYFAQHDPARTSLHAFAEVARPDDVSDWLKSHCETWHETIGRDDATVADMIRNERIDILVLLAGQTAGNRAAICKYKPALIQVNFHDLSTSGMPTVDAWLTDWTAHPKDSTEGHTEVLIRLPSVYLYRPLENAPEVAPPPSLSLGTITFGSFSNPSKINDEVLAVWARILAAIPTSRLVMAYLRQFEDAAFQDILRRRLGRFGVGPDRVAFAPAVKNRAEHLARLSAVDIMLDPFPFTGGTTTFEALWMGVPVISLAGERFAARSAASHLVAAGYPEFVAVSKEEYIEKILSLAAAPSRLEKLRQTMRAQVTGSLLCDAPAFSRALDETWRRLWTDLCRQKASA